MTVGAQRPDSRGFLGGAAYPVLRGNQRRPRCFLGVGPQESFSHSEGTVDSKAAKSMGPTPSNPTRAKRAT